MNLLLFYFNSNDFSGKQIEKEDEKDARKLQSNSGTETIVHGWLWSMTTFMVESRLISTSYLLCCYAQMNNLKNKMY